MRREQDQTCGVGEAPPEKEEGGGPTQGSPRKAAGCGIALITACLITGPPGSGKTTLLREVVALWPGKAGGFYTEEIRSHGIRQGFSLVTLSGDRVTLSHVDILDRPRIGKYGVDVAALERVGVVAIRDAARQSDLIVVDEIGKMELLSPAFREAVLEAVGSGKPVLDTIMMAPHPFADKVKGLPQVRVVLLTRENREQVKAEVLEWLGIACPGYREA